MYLNQEKHQYKVFSLIFTKILDSVKVDPVEIDSKIYLLPNKDTNSRTKNYKILLNQTSGALCAINNENNKKSRANSNLRYPDRQSTGNVMKREVSQKSLIPSIVLKKAPESHELRTGSTRNTRKSLRSVSPQIHNTEQNAIKSSTGLKLGNFKLPSKKPSDVTADQSSNNTKNNESEQQNMQTKINLSGILKRIIKMDAKKQNYNPDNEVKNLDEENLRKPLLDAGAKSHRRAASDHKRFLNKPELQKLIGKPREKTPSIERIPQPSPHHVINVSIHQNVKNVFCGGSSTKESRRNSKDIKSECKNLSEPILFSGLGKLLSANKNPENSINQDREKLIANNKLYTRTHKEIPPTTAEYYKFVRLIGKGAFGKVSLGIHKLTGKHVAIKTIDKKYMKDEFSRKKVFQEVYILKKIRHANVIRLLEVFEGPQHMLMVMEYAAGGDMLKYVKERGPLDEAEARAIFKQVLYGLGHIHSRTVLHRDIKLDNILLDTEQGVKICDFGVSKILKPNEIIKEQCGTPAYIAPEIISDEGYSGFTADYWSLGILLYAMLCAAVPYKAANLKELLEVIRTSEIQFPIKISDDAEHLIRSLLQIVPKDRLTIPQILAHPWMQVKEDESMEGNCEALLGYKECYNTQAKESPSNINIVNVGNLFSDEQTEKISYGDYCMISNDLYTQHIDEGVLRTMEKLGYPRDLVLKGLQAGDLNHATATYNLLVLP